MMKFQVIDPNGVPKMSTEYESCIPYRHLKSLEGAGYKFSVDGKVVSASKLLQKREVKTYIRCIETGELFSKQSEAAKHLNIDPAQVSDSIKTGKKRSGYTFERITEDDIN